LFVVDDVVLLCLFCRDSLNQPLPVAAAANEAYKQAKSKGYGDADFAAVYEATQVSGVSLN
jgi:3-hydroxyisobutyrate dehydrogenase-like beta-hydroxyacid dehydrogenase